MELLKNWTTLTANVAKLDEAQLAEALQHEAENNRRKAFLTRLHARFTVIRSKRERAELLGGK